MKNTISEYKRYMELKNYSSNTIELYLWDLKDFAEFLKAYDNVLLEEATRTEVLQYLYWLNEKGNKSCTKHHKIYSLKAFYKWYCREYGGINPTYSIESNKIAKRNPKYLTLEQVKKLLNITQNQKQKTIIMFFLNTGLRISEVCNIKLTDIDMSNCSVNVKCKGNKYRTTYFTTKLKKDLEIYLGEYKPHIYLFESKNGKPYSRKGMYYIIQRSYKQAGIEGMTVHALRHTVATLLYEKTKDILIVKEVLGHESIESTMVYTHVSSEAVRDTVRRNPLNM